MGVTRQIRSLMKEHPVCYCMSQKCGIFWWHSAFALLSMLKAEVVSFLFCRL